jgi:hypothetical protein
MTSAYINFSFVSRQNKSITFIGESEDYPVKLLSVEIDHFKNVLKSGPIAIQPDVTCIVGKNESGKTAVLQAIHRFKPAQPSVKFNAQRQYPAWLEKQHRRTRNIEVHVPVAATFQMEDVDIAAVEEQLGPNALKSKQIGISTSYANRFTWSPPIQEHAVIAHITAGVALTKSSVPTKLADLDALIEKFNTVAHADESATLEARSLGTELSARRAAVLGGAETTISDALWKILSPRIPKFFYFDEYS